MRSAPTDTGVKVTAKARQSREFQRHHPKKFHGVSLFGEADVWLRTTVASMWTLKIGSGVVTTDRAHYRRHKAYASDYWSHHNAELRYCITPAGTVLSISIIRGLMAEAVARDRVRDPVECTDKDNDLVMHRDKDMDMFHLGRDFNVHVWAYGQPGTTEPGTDS
ncbi:hypothetical protein Syun_019413 [Stephania yunnanensis]|uniref:Uncharacterized protein n=1 Tax=Stephania yunnanensis TaxID=152371 RepID=A0AAP0NZE4_9MAGN